MNPTLLKKLDPIARKIGLYTSYTLDEAEYIGKAEINTSNVFEDVENLRPPFVMEHDLYRSLEVGGYEQPPTFMGIPLAAAKEHPETGRVHDVSLRKVDEDNPRMQYHIHYWIERKGDGAEAKLYSHYEFRPDFARVGDETTGEMINRLRTHYRPVYGDDYVQGKADPTVRGLVE